MFYNYEIKTKDNEDILYLFFDYKYEFANEFINNEKELKRRTQNFINNRSIPFNGHKVYVIVDGIKVKTIIVNNDEDNIELLKDEMLYSNKNFLVTLKDSINNNYFEVTLQEFLLGSLSNYLSFNLEDEVLKALSVLFRTYAYKQMNTKKYIKINNKFFTYNNINYFKIIWPYNFEDNLKRIEKIIGETDSIFITYNENYIDPYFHITNNGFTKDDINLPYLKKVTSLWDYLSPFFIDIKIYDIHEFCSILNINKNELKDLIVYKNNNKVFYKINKKIYSNDYIKNSFKLNSDNFIIIFYDDYIKIIVKGYGNYYGLSLFGANELAKDNCDYFNILKYYYNDIKFKKYTKEK